jgi:predicted aminopeptidase
VKKNASFFLSFFPPVVSSVLIVSALPFFSGCYTLKQGTAMLGYLGKAVPLEEFAAESTDSDTLAFVERVEDIRRFALEELGLKASKNYTRYVELDRDYLAAVVSACAADSFTRHEWHFPVVGTVPYKGFFNLADARKEAAKLASQGLDVWIRGVDAFSTLGWFKDPLYSYMKDYTDYQLAELLIHELFHATAFVKGRVQFNEQLAEFVGTRGGRLYIETRFGADSPEYRSIDSAAADSRAFRQFLAGLGAELETIYAREDLDRDTKLKEKERIIKTSQERFEAEYESRFLSGNYRGFANTPVNNAYLDLFRLYHEDHEEGNFFENLFNEIPLDDDMLKLRALIDAAASLNKSREARKDPRRALRTALKH